MLLRKIFFTINLNIIKKIIAHIYKERINKTISRKKLNLITKKIQFKIFNLNSIFYYGVMTLSFMLMLVNLFKHNLIFLDKILIFRTLKNFYFRIITFIIYSEFHK